MDKDCVTANTWPADSCFYVFTRSFKVVGQVSPMAYLVTHNCDGSQSFDTFVSYLTSGAGKPMDRPPVGTTTCVQGPKGGKRPCDKGWSTRITLPRLTGPITPGDIVTLTVHAGSLAYQLTPTPPHPTPPRGAVAVGPIAQAGTDTRIHGRPCGGGRPWTIYRPSL